MIDSNATLEYPDKDIYFFNSGPLLIANSIEGSGVGDTLTIKISPKDSEKSEDSENVVVNSFGLVLSED